mgnify:FL=1
MPSIHQVMVVGAGQMGAGIAQVIAQSGRRVIMQDIKDDFLNRGMKKIQDRLFRLVQKQQLDEDEMEATMLRIRTTTDVSEAAEVDLVIEAAAENMEVKKNIFARLDDITPEETILATNTSSLPITEIAASTKRPQQVIGMHFMHPVPVMKLVEIIRGLATSEEVYRSVYDFAGQLGKTAVEVNDFPGFVSNRVLMPMINEAIYAVYEGVASPEAVDKVMTLGMNHPMGPLTLADFIGLDTCLAIMETLHEGFGDDKYRPCPLLRKYVKAGWLGKKTGRGFFAYHSAR